MNGLGIKKLVKMIIDLKKINKPIPKRTIK
jgi:hypothetical protein